MTDKEQQAGLPHPNVTQGPVAPEYEVVHDRVGWTHHKGDRIPPGTYSEEQIARLVELGAIKPVTPAGVDKKLVADLPESSAEYKARETARSLEAAGGDADDVKAAERQMRKAAKD